MEKLLKEVADRLEILDHNQREKTFPIQRSLIYKFINALLITAKINVEKTNYHYDGHVKRGDGYFVKCRFNILGKDYLFHKPSKKPNEEVLEEFVVPEPIPADNMLVFREMVDLISQNNWFLFSWKSTLAFFKFVENYYPNVRVMGTKKELKVKIGDIWYSDRTKAKELFYELCKKQKFHIYENKEIGEAVLSEVAEKINIVNEGIKKSGSISKSFFYNIKSGFISYLKKHSTIEVKVNENIEVKEDSRYYMVCNFSIGGKDYSFHSPYYGEVGENVVPYQRKEEEVREDIEKTFNELLDIIIDHDWFVFRNKNTMSFLESMSIHYPDLVKSPTIVGGRQVKPKEGRELFYRLIKNKRGN